METDPVCGMQVNRLEAFQAEFGGEIIFFCSRACLEAFERQPQRYAGVPQREEL